MHYHSLLQKWEVKQSTKREKLLSQRSLTRPWELSLANSVEQSAELVKTHFAEVTDVCQPA